MINVYSNAIDKLTDLYVYICYDRYIFSYLTPDREIQIKV